MSRRRMGPLSVDEPGMRLDAQGDDPRPRVGGIICPWNRDDHGPAKQRIHCMVWKDWQDFDDWAAEGDHYFCRVLCQYGRNPETARRNRRIRERYRGRMPPWFRAMPPPEAGRRVA